VRKTVTVVDVLAYSEVHGIPDDAALWSDMTWYAAQSIDVRHGSVVHVGVAGDPRPPLAGERAAAIPPLASLSLGAFRERAASAPLDAELFLVDPGLSVHKVVDLSHGDGYLRLQRRPNKNGRRHSDTDNRAPRLA
jgi:hypothetical protein